MDHRGVRLALGRDLDGLAGGRLPRGAGAACAGDIPEAAMRATLSREMEAGRVWNQALRDNPGSGPQGDFVVAPFGQRMTIVASDTRDWEASGFALPAWEHVSVSLRHRCPTWAEMEWVRDQFWEPEATVLQFSVPRSKHISHHPYCLHLWRPVGIAVPLPPSTTVAP